MDDIFGEVFKFAVEFAFRIAFEIMFRLPGAVILFLIAPENATSNRFADVLEVVLSLLFWAIVVLLIVLAYQVVT